MNKKRTYLIFLIWLGSLFSFSQDINSSSTYVRSCYDKRECFSISNSALIFFNTQNNELLLNIDFHNFRTGNDTLDAWLHELEQTHLIFKGYLHTNDLLVLSHHNSKSMMVNGEVTFNGVTKPYTIEFNLFEIANPGVLYVNNGQDYFDRVNVNMHLAFYPKDFNIDKKHHHYKSSVSIAIYRGYLNEFKPGMEYLTKSKN